MQHAYQGVRSQFSLVGLRVGQWRQAARGQWRRRSPRSTSVCQLTLRKNGSLKDEPLRFESLALRGRQHLLSVLPPRLRPPGAAIDPLSRARFAASSSYQCAGCASWPCTSLPGPAEVQQEPCACATGMPNGRQAPRPGLDQRGPCALEGGQLHLRVTERSAGVCAYALV